MAVFHQKQIKPITLIVLACTLTVFYSCTNNQTVSTKQNEAVEKGVITKMTVNDVEYGVNDLEGYYLVHFTSYDTNCGYCTPSNRFIDGLAEQYYGKLGFGRISWEPWRSFGDSQGVVKSIV